MRGRQHFFEAQTQQRGDRWGFVLTITTDDPSSWTSPWIEAGDTAEEARAEARRQFTALCAAWNGGGVSA